MCVFCILYSSLGMLILALSNGRLLWTASLRQGHAFPDELHKLKSFTVSSSVHLFLPLLF